MRFVANALSGVLLCLGFGFLVLGAMRFRLPYENGRYFDARTEVVYDVQTAEVLVIAGIALMLAGLVIAILTALSRRGRKGAASSALSGS